MYRRLVFKKPGRRKKFSFFLLRGSRKKVKLKGIIRIKNLFSFLEKRERFAVQTVILTSGVLVTQLIFQEISFQMVFLLSVLSYLLTWWSLKEDIKGIEWLLLFILPVVFTASTSLFYFLLPQRMIIRLLITVIFALGTYAILLVENIYNVAAARSIQLLRAAQSVGLLITLVIIFLTANIIYSLRLPYYINLPLLTLTGFFMALQSLWSVNLDNKISREIIMYSLIVATGVGELALALSFWPVENASFSLLLAATYYSAVGVIQQKLAEKLFFNVIREYIIVLIFTFILTFLTTRWG